MKPNKYMVQWYYTNINPKGYYCANKDMKKVK